MSAAEQGGVKQCGCFEIFQGTTDLCCRKNGDECGPWKPPHQEGKQGLSIHLAFPYADCKEQKADQAPQGASSAADASAKNAGAPPSDATKGDNEYYGWVVRKREAKRATMIRMASSSLS